MATYPPREAEAMAHMLCRHFFGITAAQMLIDMNQNIDLHTAEQVKNAVTQLLNYTPIQHITGHVDFYGCRINVNPHVLIPRPETEELVQWILQTIAPKRSVRILDIGTGSGCIAIALAARLPLASVEAWDISPQALYTAAHNADINDVKIHFREADILRPPPASALWDVIVSNPPYVCVSERAALPANVLHEPPCALFAPNGAPLLFYGCIADFARQHLVDGGSLFFEINERFGTEVVDLLHSRHFTGIELRQDLNNKDRMVRCYCPA